MIEDYHLKYEYINDGLHYNDKGLLVLRNYVNGKILIYYRGQNNIKLVLTVY